MKITELKVGNFVMILGKVREIEGLFNMPFRKDMYWVKCKGLIESKIFHFKPVPLTEELISLICGELNSEVGLYRIGMTDEYVVSFSLDNDMIYLGDDIEIRISETPLHRLQNIYSALTGEELKIQL